MRIVLRLTAALSATGILAFGIYGFVSVASEESDLRTSAEREMRLLARSLQVSIENALRDDQDRDIAETLGRLEQVEPDVDIAVHDLDGNIRSASVGSRATMAIEGRDVREAMLGSAAVVTFEPDGGLDRLVVAMPLRSDDGVLIGGLSLGKPLDGLNADLSATRTAVILTVLVFAFAASVVGLALGRWFVGKPMEQLLSAITKARAGDMHPGLPVARADEIGLAARAFSSLLAELEAARRAREQEESRRRELERTLEHADKLITVGRLTARFAHEIGSPLQVLVGRAQAIDALAEATPKVRRHARIIAEQGHRIVTIVRDLLSWAKPPGSALSPTSPRREVGAVRELLSLEARHRRIALEARFSDDVPDAPIIACRPGQLQQVVFNLVKNALAATPDGGAITLGLARADGGEELLLTVDDTGAGIPEAHRAHLFEPFFSTRLDSGGFGLGLTIVRGIVEEHGGKVELSPRTPQGTRVIVRWPIGGGVVRGALPALDPLPRLAAVGDAAGAVDPDADDKEPT